MQQTTTGYNARGNCCTPQRKKNAIRHFGLENFGLAIGEEVDFLQGIR